MKAVEANLLAFLNRSPQFIIPIYQRTYSWTEKECAQLWDDVLRAGSDDRVSAHFVGSVVYVEKGLYQVSSHTPVLVIDGQQRLTTVTLILEALARHLGDDEPVDGFSARKLRHYYLLNPEESGDRHFKLLLTQNDRDTLLAIVQQKEILAEHSVRVKENFEYFDGKIASLNGDLAALCTGLAKLLIVDVALNRDQDNPQLIFESMNSTGRELTQADLVRNFVLMGLEPEHQTALYHEHWRPMEELFGQEAYGDHFNAFMRNYLIVKTGGIPRFDQVYEAFKTFSRTPDVKEQGVDALVADVHRFARHYSAMALGREARARLAEAFQDLRELKVDVAYPFLLELYEDNATGLLSDDDFLTAVRLVESYVFRRAVCAIPTNSLNKTFATFRRSLKKDRYLESIRAHLLLLPSYRRFPGDEEFKRELKVRDLYNFRSRSYWLRRLENHGRKERVPVDEYTIEHVLPQNENLSDAWREVLGDGWETVQEKYLHTLGNLTLTGYNSEYSDRPFPEKRDMPGGFRESPLRLNDGLGKVEEWDESAIQQRADRLAQKATEVWPAPRLEADVLDAYKAKPKRTSDYSIADHPYLLGGPVGEVFQAFRKGVLALDPDVVTEEFLKLYVAYKAETNFADVIPQAKRLLVSLNIDFHDVHDPRGLCRDVANLGRWGNGNTEAVLASLDDVPYVVGLARQALERQLSDKEVTE